MEKLAFITWVDDTGRDFGCAACEVMFCRETESGCIVTLRNGREVTSQSTVAQMQTKIDTLWDEYTTALGDPA